MKKSQHWHNFKITVPGGGGLLLAANSTLTAEDRNILVNSLSLATGGLGVAAAGVLGEAAFLKRASLATSIEKEESLKNTAGTLSRASLLLVIGVAIFIAAKDAMLAIKSTSKASMSAYGTAAVFQVGVAGIASYNLLTEVAKDNIGNL